MVLPTVRNRFLRREIKPEPAADRPRTSSLQRMSAEKKAKTSGRRRSWRKKWASRVHRLRGNRDRRRAAEVRLASSKSSISASRRAVVRGDDDFETTECEKEEEEEEEEGLRRTRFLSFCATNILVLLLFCHLSIVRDLLDGFRGLVEAQAAVRV